MWENLYTKMQRSDFTLVFDGHSVDCHKVVFVDPIFFVSFLFIFFFFSYKVVLAAASPVFEAMVENEHKEGIEGKANIAISLLLAPL